MKRKASFFPRPKALTALALAASMIFLPTAAEAHGGGRHGGDRGPAPAFAGHAPHSAPVRHPGPPRHAPPPPPPRYDGGERHHSSGGEILAGACLAGVLLGGLAGLACAD